MLFARIVGAPLMYNEKIVKLIESRLEKGKEEYPDDLDVHDGRDWIQESLKSVLDLAVYVTAKLIQLKEKQRGKMKVNTTSMSREDWLKERMKSIGGSDVGNILGVGYQTPLYIYYTKVGERDTDIEINSRMEAGNRLEDVVAQWCADENGLTIRNDNFMHYKKDNPILSANVDKVIVDKSERGNGILEVKTTSSFNVKKYEKGIPYNYMLQLQHYLNVMDLKWGMVTKL